MTQSRGEMREMYPGVGEAYHYRTEEREGHFSFDLEGETGAGLIPAATLSIESQEPGEGLCRTESDQTHAFAWAWIGPELHLWLDGALFVFQREETRRRGKASAEGSGDVLAPMPGVVLEVLAGEGERVERSQTVAILESMKTELVITASLSGVVRRVEVHPGQRVGRGMRLLELAPSSDVEE